MKKILLLNIFLSLVVFTFSQSNISFKATLFGLNPAADPNKSLYKPNFIDTTGFFTIHPSFQIAAEIYGCKNASAKIVQNYAKDQVGFSSGYSQVLINLYIVNNKKNYLKFGFGPAVFYRRNWELLSGYTIDDYYYDLNNTQYKMKWLSFEMEYGWYRNKDSDFVVSINQIYPKSFAIYFGMKFWISRRNTHCSTCPSYR